MEGSRDWPSYLKSTCTLAGQPASTLGLLMRGHPHQSRVRGNATLISLQLIGVDSHTTVLCRGNSSKPRRGLTTSGEQGKDRKTQQPSWDTLNEHGTGWIHTDDQGIDGELKSPAHQENGGRATGREWRLDQPLTQVSHFQSLKPFER